MPHCFIGPVIFTVSPVNHRIERRINLFACEDVFGFLMLLITNRMRIGTRCRDEEVQGLGSGIVSPASSAPSPISLPSKSNGSFSGSSRRVAGRPAASFSFNGSGFAPARTRRPPRFVPSFAMGCPAVE